MMQAITPTPSRTAAASGLGLGVRALILGSLLHDDVGGMLFNDAFYRSRLMTGDDDEPMGSLVYGRVRSDGHQDRLIAVGASARAVELDLAVPETSAVVSLVEREKLDLLVDLSDQPLVVGEALEP
jgi:hypothetical protein